MAFNAIYILDLKGKVIITRNYRGDLPSNIAYRFISKILEEEELNISPVVLDEEYSYIYVKYNNVYVMAVSEINCNVAMILLFLYKMIGVFQEYFKELEEESIRDNFVITYELLDEMMDFGYPQTTETKLLQEFITQESHKLTKQQVQVPKGLTGAVSWRSEDIKHRKNEVFLDVIESINLLVASNGNLLRSEIVGCIKMRSYLSGMPELRLGLNDRVQFESTGRSLSKGTKAIEMEDVTFHQCVKLSRFETDRTISFIPPDGEFELMSYRLNTNVKPLIWIEAIVESHKNSRIEYMIKARSQFKQRSTANNVQIFIPVPRDADTPKFKSSIGNVKYAPEKDAIVWTIKQFPGGKEYLMRAHFGLPSISDEDPSSKPPITVKFEIPYFTVSGIQVRYLKIIEKSGYQALPWVRYITQSGDYQIRMI
jgi:AP-1 complex subunit mu